MIAAFLRNAIHDEPISVWGDGSVVRDYIFIDDVVSAIELAVLNGGDKKIFNIGSGRGLSVNEIILTLESVVGKKIEVNYMPGRNMDVPISVLDIAQAAEVLRWTPKVEFSQGIQDTFEWVKSSGL